MEIRLPPNTSPTHKGSHLPGSPRLAGALKKQQGQTET